MSRSAMFSVREKQRIVFGVLRGECTVAEAARCNKCSETSIAKWRDQFVQAGVAALEAGAARGPSLREAQLERELEGVMAALGEAHVRLRLAERDGAAVFIRGAGGDPPARRDPGVAVLLAGGDPAPDLVSDARAGAWRPGVQGAVAQARPPAG